jgi:hypothetical protein
MGQNPIASIWVAAYADSCQSAKEKDKGKRDRHLYFPATLKKYPEKALKKGQKSPDTLKKP